MDNNIVNDIDFFMEYMKAVKNASENTLQSYRRDLMAMAKYFCEQDVENIERINGTNINSYIFYMEKQGKSAATISRSISSIKTFFRCMINNGRIRREPTENLHIPQNESKKTDAISKDDLVKIICQIGEEDSKALRDNAMLRLMLDTGIKVSEIIDIKLIDVNLEYTFVTCRGRKKDKTIRFGNDTLYILEKYITNGRKEFIKNNDMDQLFLNCFGRKMSRQGFWKIFKEHAFKAGVEGISTRALHK